MRSKGDGHWTTLIEVEFGIKVVIYLFYLFHHIHLCNACRLWNSKGVKIMLFGDKTGRN
jgi:hypothetical protein